MQNLSSLIRPYIGSEIPESLDCPVGKLVLDSRKIQEGDVFVALSGHVSNGHDFIPKALKSGAAAVIAQANEEHAHGIIEEMNGAAIVYVQDLPTQLSALAIELCGDIDMPLVVVTGTNGKTTITQIIAQWIELLGKRAAVMGTAGNGFLNNIEPALNTTGSAIEVVETLSGLRKQGADFAALEASSHGLVQNRIKALTFDVGVFSNLSRDHLDYHNTMEEYADAKFGLFRDHKCQKPVINVDDPVGAEWVARLDNALAVSLQEKPVFEKTLYATDVQYSSQGIKLSFDGFWGSGELVVPLIGAFNASNVLLAFGSLLELGFEKSELTAVAPKLAPVIGRMELFQAENKAKVVVDYAHTPDALEKALMALRVHCEGNLWAIFGCGGDRDTGKRPMMAEIAERLADHAILTDDNPRSESPETIVKDMLAGMKVPENAVVKHDRFQACLYALENASHQDIILLAGKGHEDYQVLASETVHYSDRETAEQLLGIKG